MTTIACTRTQMAADSMLSADAEDIKVRKIQVIGRSLVACAGDTTQCSRFVEWLARGCKGRPRFTNMEALVLNAQGIFFYDEACRPKEVTEPYAAIGTGTQAAMAALRSGMGARAAVNFACLGDKNSAPPVFVRSVRSITPKGKS